MVRTRNLLLAVIAAALLLGGLAEAGGVQSGHATPISGTYTGRRPGYVPAVSPRYMFNWMSRILGPRNAQAMLARCFGPSDEGLRSESSGGPFPPFGDATLPHGGMMGFDAAR